MTVPPIDADDPLVRYREHLDRLAAARDAALTERAQVHEWYAQQCADSRRAVSGAEARLAAARETLAGAQAAVDFTDAESVRLWQILGYRLGPRRAAELGPPPAPAVEPTAGQRAPRLLDAVRELLDLVVPERRRPPGYWLVPVLGLLAVLALVVVLLLRPH